MKLLRFKLSLLVLCALATSALAQQTKVKEKPMTDSSRVKTVGQIAIRVKDVARAVAFYRDKLGLKVLLQQANLAVLDCGGVSLFLTPPENATEAGHNSIIYFDVDDIQQTAQTLTAQGVTVVEAPNKVGSLGSIDVWIAIFRDSEENLMGLRSLRPERK